MDIVDPFLYKKGVQPPKNTKASLTKATRLRYHSGSCSLLFGTNTINNMEIKRLIVGALETNCYLLVSNSELGIVDPGGEAKKILKEIEGMEAKPKYIINTHNHPDHTAANEKIKKEIGAQILTNLKNGEEIKIGNTFLKVIQTPGHTKDSICLLGHDFIFTGDTLFENGHGRTDLPGGSQKEMEESLEKLSKLLKPGVTVYPGHGEIFQY